MLKLQDSCISNVGRGAIYRGLFIRGALLFVCFACSLVSCVRMTKTSLVKNRASWPIRVHGRAVKPARGGGKPCNRCFNMRPGRVVFGRRFLVSWFTDWANLSRKRARSLPDPRWRQRLIRGKAWVWSATAWRHRGASHSARSFFSSPFLGLKMLRPANEKRWCEWRHASSAFWLVDCKRVSWHLRLGLRPLDTSVTR